MTGDGNGPGALVSDVALLWKMVEQHRQVLVERTRKGEQLSCSSQSSKVLWCELNQHVHEHCICLYLMHLFLNVIQDHSYSKVWEASLPLNHIFKRTTIPANLKNNYETIHDFWNHTDYWWEQQRFKKKKLIWLIAGFQTLQHLTPKLAELWPEFSPGFPHLQRPRFSTDWSTYFNTWHPVLAKQLSTRFHTTDSTLIQDQTLLEKCSV